MDQFLDVVGPFGIGRDEVGRARVLAVWGRRRGLRRAAGLRGCCWAGRRGARGSPAPGRRRRSGGEVGDAALARGACGAAELLLGDLLVGHGLDDVRPGDEHVARVLDHDDEVGDRRRVDGAAGAGPHDGADLRHHARGEGVAQEDVGVAAERRHAFLDARAARVVEADDRRADLSIARSMTLQIFSALVSDSEPPKTVKSDPGSSKSSTRSRAVSLPAVCWRSMRSCPPPNRAASRRWSSSLKAALLARLPASGGTQSAATVLFRFMGWLPRFRFHGAGRAA